MQQEFSESQSDDLISISIMSIQNDDSDLNSLLHNVEAPFDQQYREKSQNLEQKFKKQGVNSDQSQKNVSDRIFVDKQKGYYSDCNEQPYRPRKRYTRVYNKNDNKYKKRRTRAYIQMLQNRIQELNGELEKLTKLNKMNKDYIKKLNYSEQAINGFFVGKQQIYEKVFQVTEDISKQNKARLLGIPEPNLQSIHFMTSVQSMKNKTIKSDSNTDPSQNQYSKNEALLMQQIKALRLRQGVFGSDRIKAVNYYFKELVQLILPDIQKYVLLAVEESSDMFDPEYSQQKVIGEGIQEWRKEMLQKMQLEKVQLKQIQKLKEPLLKQKAQFDKLLSKFYEIKCHLSNQARRMQALFDNLNLVLKPKQIGMCLCYIEKYKFQKGFSTASWLAQLMGKLSQEVSYYNNSNPFDQTIKAV